MRFINRMMGNPFDGFDNFEDYILAVARGAVVEYNGGRGVFGGNFANKFTPCIRILFDNQEDIYFFETNEIVYWEDDLKEIANIIKQTNDKFYGFVTAYVSNSIKGTELKVTGVCREDEELAIDVVCPLSYQARIYISDKDIADLNDVYSTLIKEITFE